ncbi:hypothetical protein F0919_00405 [Taibaiella lutea]|uniref:Uncharacterized protein n=1 Tax=Taibaiella lutea TaxID=2608001 RepID=A0A5M6CMD0_9BACT|nr:hypothetical protein F0919_00405 [Taibaiella lutea]
MPTIHQRYHSDFKAEYSQGRLPIDVIKKIPRSTRQRWSENEKKKIWMPVADQHNVVDELTIRILTKGHLSDLLTIG